MHSKRYLGIIIAVSILLRLCMALYLQNSVTELPGVSDQLSYHLLANRVIDGYGFTFEKLWWPMTYPGQPTAHWSFLYTLALAISYALAGPNPIYFRVFQALVSGILMPFFTFLITREFVKMPGRAPLPFKDWPPLFAAGWTAIYGYFVYYAGALMTEAFYITSILWVLWTALRLAKAEPALLPSLSLWPWLEFGLSICVTILLRQVFLLFVPFIFAWLLWVYLRNNTAVYLPVIRGTVKGILTVSAVLTLLVLPVTLYNYGRFGRLVLLNTNAGFAFYWANHPIHGDRFIPVLTPDMPSYQDLIPSELLNLNEAELDSALLTRGINFVLADPARYIRLSISRIPVYFMFWPSQASGLISNLVRLISFGLLAPASMFGIGVWVRNSLKFRSLNPVAVLLLLFIVVYSAIHLLSWALIRYRLPVDAALLVFAGSASGLFAARVLTPRETAKTF
jgi:hypothetical protein